jgi:hypothetical protein
MERRKPAKHQTYIYFLELASIRLRLGLETPSGVSNCSTKRVCYSQACKDGKIPNKSSQGNEEHVLRHEIEGESRHQERRAHCEDIQSLLTRLKFAGFPTMNSKNQVNSEDGRECDVQEGPLESSHQNHSVNVFQCTKIH